MCAKNAGLKQYKKYRNPEEVLKITILVQNGFKIVINTNSKKLKK